MVGGVGGFSPCSAADVCSPSERDNNPHLFESQAEAIERLQGLKDVRPAGGVVGVGGLQERQQLRIADASGFRAAPFQCFLGVGNCKEGRVGRGREQQRAAAAKLTQRGAAHTNGGASAARLGRAQTSTAAGWSAQVAAALGLMRSSNPS